MGEQAIKITAKDGAEITASLYRAASPQRKVLFLLLPAMGVKASYYRPLTDGMTGLGYDMMLCDLRGQGSSNRKAPKAKFGYADMLEYDLPAYVDAAKQACPNAKIILLGHSLGGHLSLLYRAVNPEFIDACAIIASGSVYYNAYRGLEKIKILLATQGSILISALFGYFPGHRLGFGGKQPKTVMRDWARQGRTGQFIPKGARHEYEAELALAQFPLFALSIEGDNFAPHYAVDHLVQKAAKAKLTRIRYSPPKDLIKKIDHFRWVKHSGEILSHLARWEDAL